MTCDVRIRHNGVDGFLTTSLLASNSVIINWSDNTDGESGYELVKTANGVETTIPLPADTSSYRVTGLNPATTYGFRVRAVNAATESCPSPTLTVTTRAAGVPVAPTDLHATSDYWNSNQITWTDNSDNETGFTVDRLNLDGSWTTVGTVGANVSSFTDNSVTANTDYTYRVIANGPDDDSSSDDSSSTDDGSDTGNGDGGGDDNTDNGDGLDHDGKADVQSEIAFGDIYSIAGVGEGGSTDGPGIQREWTKPPEIDWDTAGGLPSSNYWMAQDGETLTLTLRNLPKHAALTIGGWGSPSDNSDPNGPQREFKVDGHALAAADYLEADNVYFLEHTGSTATITIKMTGVSYWYPEFTVGMDSPKITAPSATLTVGETKEFQVSATDPLTGGAWRKDLNLSPEIKDGDSVTPIGGTILIHALSGVASIVLKGAAVGLCKLLLTDQVSGVASQPATQQAAPYIVILDHEVVTLAVGQTTIVRAKLRSVTGEKVKNNTVEPPKLTEYGGPGGSASVVGPDPDNDDAFLIKVTAKHRFVAAVGMAVRDPAWTVTDPNDTKNPRPPSLRLQVSKTVLSVTPNTVAIDHNHLHVPVTARVTDGHAGPVADVQVWFQCYYYDGAGTAHLYLSLPDTTPASGEVTFNATTFTGAAVPAGSGYILVFVGDGQSKDTQQNIPLTWTY